MGIYGCYAYGVFATDKVLAQWRIYPNKTCCNLQSQVGLLKDLGLERLNHNSKIKRYTTTGLNHTPIICKWFSVLTIHVGFWLMAMLVLG